jgi:predicted  nucleic acid-binding Zn-ribbon protein
MSELTGEFDDRLEDIDDRLNGVEDRIMALQTAINAITEHLAGLTLPESRLINQCEKMKQRNDILLEKINQIEAWINPKFTGCVSIDDPWKKPNFFRKILVRIKQRRGR